MLFADIIGFECLRALRELEITYFGTLLCQPWCLESWGTVLEPWCEGFLTIRQHCAKTFRWQLLKSSIDNFEHIDILVLEFWGMVSGSMVWRYFGHPAAVWIMLCLWVICGAMCDGQAVMCYSRMIWCCGKRLVRL